MELSAPAILAIVIQTISLVAVVVLSIGCINGINGEHRKLK